MKKTRTKYLRLAAVALIAAVALLDAAFLILPDAAMSPAENRALQQMPAVTLDGLTSGRFESRFEDYVADQFPLRTGWVRVKSALDRLLGKVESNGVFLGRDGWLIQNFNEPDAENYRQTVEAVRGFCTFRANLRQYMIVAPSAVTVCADKLPANAPAGDESGFIDRLQSDLSGTPLQFIDVRETLAALAREQQPYYRTDHHWTTPAAYAAYLQFARAAELPGAAVPYEPVLLSDSFSGTLTASSGFRMDETDPLVAYLPESSVNYVVTYAGESGRHASVYWTENLNKRDQYTVFFNGNHPQVTIETGAESRRALLMLKDSYANCFAPFLIQDFRRIIMIDPRYYTGDLGVLIESEAITDVLFLYNANTLAGDAFLKMDLK